MRVEDIEFLDQRTFTLLIDIALLLDESERCDKPWIASSFARSAIMNSSLLLECISNSCLTTLALPSKLLNEIDRLPVLSKLDYFLFANTGAHIDRGCREVQLVSEVLKLRDHIVHPKPKPGNYVSDDRGERVDYGSSSSMDIAFDSRDWDHKDGAKVAHAVTQFLELFFLNWCRLEKGHITRMLGCREKGLLSTDQVMWVQVSGPIYGLILKWLPSLLAFMDVRSGGDKA
ncbi:hypothetical protein [Marinobacter subterrani]|uniref:Uncharacterized protein n=1 Tax=Marinobacter subterrani TaxID=1658765 RepID=A0A0J7J7F0_9GAMM|nr:hypothetical protein [Marinobacter subterrani]KMQ74067.1 hypothetical protein Msub_10238 [Marinobacter subterrani]